MAKAFVAASSEYLNVFSAVLSGPPISMTGWFKTTNIDAESKTVVSITSRGNPGNRFALYLRGSSTTVAAIARSSVSAIAQSSTTYSTSGVWQHAGGLFTSDTSRAAIHQGALGTAETSTITITGVNSTTIGAQDQATYVNFADGSLAEIGVYNVALEADEWAALGDGVSPLLVRPASLVLYVPFLGGANTDMIGGTSWTVGGTPTTDTHPAVIMPHNGLLVPAAAAVSTTALPLLNAYYHG